MCIADFDEEGRACSRPPSPVPLEQMRQEVEILFICIQE
jgi:hypothetical protein